MRKSVDIPINVQNSTQKDSPNKNIVESFRGDYLTHGHGHSSCIFKRYADYAH